MNDPTKPDPYLEGIAKRWGDWEQNQVGPTQDRYKARYQGWPKHRRCMAWIDILRQIEQDVVATYHAPTKVSHVHIPRQVSSMEGADITAHLQQKYPAATITIFQTKDASLIRIEHMKDPNE